MLKSLSESYLNVENKYVLVIIIKKMLGYQYHILFFNTQIK